MGNDNPEVQKNGENTLAKTIAETPFPLSHIDKWVLSQTDEEFHLQTWEDLKKIIDANELETLKRKPSDLRRYIAWSQDTKAKYGSITNYLIQYRLPWGSPPFTFISSTPFEETSDFKILINDWPYGMTSDVTHIVAWSKTPIATDGKLGDVTGESRKIIEDFVKKTFVKRLDGDESRVIWFKNWVSLQSVRALEHVHILVRNATKEDLEFWTGEKA